MLAYKIQFFLSLILALLLWGRDREEVGKYFDVRSKRRSRQTLHTLNTFLNILNILKLLKYFDARFKAEIRENSVTHFKYNLLTQSILFNLLLLLFLMMVQKYFQLGNDDDDFLFDKYYMN